MKKKQSRKKGLSFGKILLILLLLFATITVIENISVGVTSYTVDTGHYSAEESALRIVQLSDIHMIRRPGRARQLLRKVTKLSPDVIAITGDLIDTGKYRFEELQQYTINFCSELCTIAPVYLVYGNHEMALLDDPVNNPFKLELETVGVQILNNAVEEFYINGRKYVFLGVQDPSTLYKDRKYAFLTRKTTAVLTDITADIDTDDLTILLTHRPEDFKIYTEDFGIDLTLTGHAHGGQFRIPFTDIALYAPNQGYFPKYTSGMFESSGNYMIVSRGLGNSRIPVRLFNMPEIVVVDVK